MNTQLIFPDNTVLVNFAIISRMDLLEQVVNGRAAWCATVSTECAQSAEVDGLEALRQAPDIFGVALRPTQAELVDTQVLRLELASPGDSSLAHLGEAETLAIMIRRGHARYFVTDDGNASRLAGKHGIAALSTWDLIRLAIRAERVDPDAAWGYLQTLRSQARGTPRGVTTRLTFDTWHGKAPAQLSSVPFGSQATSAEDTPDAESADSA